MLTFTNFYLRFINEFGTTFRLWQESQPFEVTLKPVVATTKTSTLQYEHELNTFILVKQKTS